MVERFSQLGSSTDAEVPLYEDTQTDAEPKHERDEYSLVCSRYLISWLFESLGHTDAHTYRTNLIYKQYPSGATTFSST